MYSQKNRFGVHCGKGGEGYASGSNRYGGIRFGNCIILKPNEGALPSLSCKARSLSSRAISNFGIQQAHNRP